MHAQEPSNTARIAVRSHRQAMDWSLVLLSQGIETTILPPGPEGGWSLLIPAEESQRAFKSLRQYRIENRGLVWRQELSWQASHFHWGSTVWAAILVWVYGLSARDPSFLHGGIMDSGKVLSGQWWRIFTAMTLHADLGHLAANLSIGVVFMGLAMGEFGVGCGALGAYLAGAGGNIVSLFLNAKPFHGLGASGMVMGSLGLLAAQSIHPKNRHLISRKFLAGGVAAWVLLFILFGLAPESDIAAHLGGFLSGTLLGLICAHLPAGILQKPTVNFASVIVLLALVTGTWQLAFKSLQ